MWQMHPEFKLKLVTFLLKSMSWIPECLKSFCYKRKGKQLWHAHLNNWYCTSSQSIIWCHTKHCSFCLGLFWFIALSWPLSLSHNYTVIISPLSHLPYLTNDFWGFTSKLIGSTDFTYLHTTIFYNRTLQLSFTTVALSEFQLQSFETRRFLCTPK